MHLYTDIDPFCVSLLQRLVDKKQLPLGLCLQEDVRKLQNLERFTQVHLFAGVGGWPLAIDLLGLPIDFPLWTGSCPCQPFSVSGELNGTKDERHLWPDFRNLIEAYRPTILMGEQVAGEAGLLWLEGVVVDMEKLGYKVRAVCAPACSIGAAHVRPRLYWMAYSNGEGLERCKLAGSIIQQQPSSVQLRAVSLRKRLSSRATPTTIMPLDGLSRSVGFIRAMGNAIVPVLAAEIAKAFFLSVE